MSEPTANSRQPITVDEIRSHFESDYQVTEEPWNYSQAGAELLRFKRVVEIAKRLAPKPEYLLEIGCSLGLFSIELAGWPKRALITDIAPTAVAKAKALLQKTDAKGTQFEFETASGTDAFRPAGTFDVITLLDVTEAVADSPHIQEMIVLNLKQMLTPGGLLLVTDYMHPRRFEEKKDKYRQWGFEIVEEHLMNDRLWYSFRTNLKAVKHLFPFKHFLASRTIAKGIAAISSLRGRNGSKHQMLVLRAKA